MSAHVSAASKRIFAAIVRAALFAAAVFALQSGTAFAYNPYYDDFIYLSARPLSMGASGVALSAEPSSVFYNPAGFSGVRGLTLMHNHSGRHFPEGTYSHEDSAGKKRLDADHLDGDTQAIILSILPSVAIGIGFNFEGEMGYDYRPFHGMPATPFPVERLSLAERIEAISVAISPWTQAGVSRRSFFHVYERPDGGYSHGAYPPVHPADFENMKSFRWNRTGEGVSTGGRQWIAPGIFSGASSSSAEFEYEDGSSGEFSRSRRGYAFHPAGWLTLVFDKDVSSASFKDFAGNASAILPRKSASESSWGWEINLAGLAKLRGGSLSGDGTKGAEIKLGKLSLNYAEAKAYLPRILGGDSGIMRNVHIYGFTLAIP